MQANCEARRLMKKILFLCLLMAAASCQRKALFTVNGHVTEAEDTVMYLEHITLGDGIVPVDSVRLTAGGAFCLQGEAPANPEFYRLRIGGQAINLAFDSTETVTVEASLPQMSFGYRVEGSGACDTIRLLSLKMAELDKGGYLVAAGTPEEIAKHPESYTGQFLKEKLL